MSLPIAAVASRLSLLRPQVGAAITKGGRVLSVGYNRKGSSKFSQWSRHAEITAIIAAGDVRGATLWVYRAHGKTGEPLLAKPCSGCAEAAQLAGIKKVVYTQTHGRG